MKLKNIYFLSFALLALIGCRKDALEESPSHQKILHIAHTRSVVEGEINEKLSEIDYEPYDVLCLGGDIDLHTSKDEKTMQAWDNLFHFDRKNTLWSLGNHDITDRELIKKYTNRPSYYFWTYQSLNFLVLDDQINNSNIIGNQLELLKTIADTISNASHFIVLTHRLLWIPQNTNLEPFIDSIPNGGSGNCGFCTKENNFYKDVYPILLKINNKGIEVICIAGDLGIKTNQFEYQTNEGVHFLASGLNVHTDNNKVLLMEYRLEERTLNWWFENLDNL